MSWETTSKSIRSSPATMAPACTAGCQTYATDTLGNVVNEEASHDRARLVAGDDPGDPEARRAIDRRELPDLADALEVADVEGIEEELVPGHIGADVDRPRPLDRADLAEDPLGQRATLGGSQALGRGEPRQAPPEPGPAEDVGHPAVADPPAAVAGRGQDEGDRPLAVGRVLDGVRFTMGCKV
jgi:hypothetical protein